MKIFCFRIFYRHTQAKIRASKVVHANNIIMFTVNTLSLEPSHFGFKRFLRKLCKNACTDYTLCCGKFHAFLVHSA